MDWKTTTKLVQVLSKCLSVMENGGCGLVIVIAALALAIV